MDPVIKQIADGEFSSEDHLRLGNQYLEHLPDGATPRICVCSDCELFRTMIHEGRVTQIALQQKAEESVRKMMFGSPN